MNAQGYVTTSPAKSKTGMYIIIAVVVLLLTGGGYYYYTMDDEEDEEEDVVVEATVVTPSIPNTNNVVISDAVTANQLDSQASGDDFPEEIEGCIIEDADNYSSLATVQGTAVCTYKGCMEEEADNYKAKYNVEGPCTYTGCMEEEADNYKAKYNVEGPCTYTGCMETDADNYKAKYNVEGPCTYTGCMETDADNYKAKYNVDDGSCQWMGCRETDADNYDPRANVEGECDYLGCTDDRYEEFDPDANKDTIVTSCLTRKPLEAAVSDKPYGRVFSTPSGGNPGHFRYEYQSGGTVWNNSEYVANNDQNNNFSDWTRCNSEADFGTCLEPYIDECYKICDGSTECQGFNVNYKNITENGHKPYCYFYNKSAQLVDTETSAGRAGYIKSEGRAVAPVVLPTSLCKVTLYSEKNLGGEGVEFTQNRETQTFQNTNFGNRAQSWKREGSCLDKTVRVHTGTMQRGSSFFLPGSYDSGNFMGDFVNNIESMKIT